MKLMEQESGIVTQVGVACLGSAGSGNINKLYHLQHVSSQTVDTVFGGGPTAERLLGNLVLKFNEKSGGVNYGLCTSNEFLRRSGQTQDVV